MKINEKPAAVNKLRPVSIGLKNEKPPIFFFPSKTLPVSATGANCPLKCEHCQGHFLKSMINKEEALDLKRTERKSFLISGGCDHQGQVILPSTPELKRLGEKGKLNLHITLIDSEEINRIKPLAHTISQDIHGSDRVIKEVLGLKKSFSDYARSYQLVRKQARVIPHVLIGLDGEDFSGEEKVIKLLEEHPPEAAIFLVYLPLVKSKMLPQRPPQLEKVISLLEKARNKLAQTPLILGCMRPGGKYRKSLDRQVLEIGIDGIVQPSVAYSNPVISRECCALWTW